MTEQDCARSEGLLAQMLALHPTEIDLSLDRMHRLLQAMGAPHERLKNVLHIAGTNGKGSTQAYLKAGLRAAGRSVAAYTSPHLVQFHERIELPDGPIQEPVLCDVLERTLTANGPHPITYFEATTAAAFLAFAEATPDDVILEVGLGGRLDATNVIAKPRLCVITPIDMDHQDFLGDTLHQIAAEKAGILKAGVPCIVGRQQDAALDVIERRAERLGAPLCVLGQHWHAWQEHDRLVFQDETGLLDLPLPRLPGRHQIENAGMALAALRSLGMQKDVCTAAMQTATWPARMERLRGGALSGGFAQGELWLDGGHNPAAAQALADTLRSLPPRPLHLIVGLQGQKDVDGYLAPLLDIASSLTAVPVPAARGGAADPEALAKRAQEMGCQAGTAPDVHAALAHLAKEASEARVLVCGSLYLAGDVLKAERGHA